VRSVTGRSRAAGDHPYWCAGPVGGHRSHSVVDSRGFVSCCDHEDGSSRQQFADAEIVIYSPLITAERAV